MKHRLHIDASESALLHLAADVRNSPDLSGESPVKQKDSALQLLEKHPFLKKLSTTPPSLYASPGYVDIVWYHDFEGSYEIRITQPDTATPYPKERDFYQNPRRVYQHVWVSQSF